MGAVIFTVKMRPAMRMRMAGATAALVFGVLLMPVRSSAQTLDAVTRAAATLTPAALEEHLTALAADSLRPRPTPSPALERAARYVAAAFARAGLQPAKLYSGDSTTRAWVQYYPLPRQRRFRYAASTVELGTWRDTANFASAAYFDPGVAPPELIGTMMVSFDAAPLEMGSGSAVLVSGRQTAATLAQAARQPGLADKVVIYVPPATADSTERQGVVAKLIRASKGVVLTSDEDSARFAARVRVAQQHSLVVTESFMHDPVQDPPRPWAVVVRGAALRGPLDSAGVDLAAVRADPTPRVRPLQFSKDAHAYRPVRLRLVADTTTPVVTAPIVVALLEGSDSTLRNQLLVLSAHLDAGPLAAGTFAAATSDTTASGKAMLDHTAPDNTAGVASLLALARALTEPAGRPRRSVLFVVSSGGAKDEWWGTRYFLEPRRQLPGMVANLTLDLSGRLPGDTMTIDGMADLEGLPVAAWTTGAHPELGLTVLDGGTALAPKSEHLVFMHYMVPSLYVHTVPSGDHAESRVATAGSSGESTEPASARLARVAQLTFYLVQALANMPVPVRWTSEFRRTLLLGP